MAGVKLSAIVAAGAISGADTIVGVQTGPADVQYTFTNAAAAISTILGLTSLATTAPGTGVVTALGNTAGGAGGFALVGTTPPTGSAGGDLTGTYPNPTIKASVSLTTPNINVAIGTSLALNGATIGTNALSTVGAHASWGASGSAPGFYAYLTGDTVARVRIGMDSADVPSLAFGPGSVTARDTFFYRTGAAALAAGGSSSTTNASITAGSFIPTSSTVPTNGMYLSAANTVAFATNGGTRWGISAVGTLFVSSNASGASIATSSPSSTSPNVVPNRSDGTTGIGAQAAGNISLIVGATEKVRVTSTGVQVISGNALQLGNAATTGLVAGVLSATTNASIVITDSTGQAYRIPCII